MEFLSTVVFRAPLLPYSTELNKELIKGIVKSDSAFSSGVLLASPALHGNLEGDKAYFALGRYYTRSKTRPTPFGLFSGSGTVKWADKTVIVLKENRKAHIYLDIELIRAIQQEIENKNDPNLLYFPNSSLYKIGNEVRFMNFDRIPSLVSIHATPEIENLIHQAQLGICKSNCTKNQVKLFDALVTHQVLTSELETPCTGDDPFFNLIKHFTSYSNLQPWENLNSQIKYLRKELSTHALEAFKKVLPPMEKIPLHVTQTCSTVPEKNKLNKGLQRKLLNTLHRLQHWSPVYANDNLENFILRFQERYAEEEIPLVEVFDPEYGIEYLPTSPLSDLTDGLPVSSIPLPSVKEENLGEELLTLIKRGQYAIELPHREDGKVNLNASFSLVFRLVEQGKIHLEMAGGSSATALLGRFGNSDKMINNLLHKIVAEEAKWNPDVDFAEVLNLPDGKSGNVIFRPPLRSFEIPYLGRSNNPSKQQINIQDLLISVVQGQIILRNKQTHRRIIPRIANAHNFRLSPLPIYRFLGDLQFQGHQPSLHFSWGKMESSHSFLPRVSVDNVILHPASWSFRKSDFHLVKEGKLPHCQFPLPRYFIWKNSDQELWVDRENIFSLECFYDAIQSLETIRVYEFLTPDDQAIKSRTGKAFCHQFIASIIQQRALFTDKNFPITSNDCRRDFCPGSEWVFLKYYSGPKGAERILKELISPIIEHVTKIKWVDKWFFLHYFDPEPHVRLRLHLTSISWFPEVLKLCDMHSLPFLKDRSIWKVQIDTYKREIERYQAKNIGLVESIFFWDSSLILKRIKKIEGDNWYWTIRQIKIYLNAAEFTLDEKRNFVSKMSTALGQEFCADKKVQIDKKYRVKKYSIEKWLSHGIKVPKTLNHYLLSIKKNTPSQFQEVLASLIHMMINRSISCDPRTHEYLMYEFLVRYYKGYAARIKLT